MIKRPFLWGIGAFAGGILLAWKKVPLPFLLIPSILGWLLTYLLIYHFKKFLNRKDSFLWSLPFLMLLGFLAMKGQMKPPDMDTAFGNKASCILTGKIDMIVKRPKGYAYYLKDNRVNLSEDTDAYPVESIIVYSGDTKEYQVGNKISVSGTIYKFSENTNPGGFNERLYYKIQNIDYKVYSDSISIIDSRYSKFHNILNSIKERFISTYMQILPEKEAGILTAMVLGEKYMLEDEIKDLYQENGISHILAISGLHISMIGAAVYIFLRKIRLGLYASTVLSMAFIYCYGVLTNFSVSTNRAVVMYSVMLAANLLGKTFDLLSALSLSAFIILIQNPMQIFHAGFLLSFGAVLGISLIFPCLNRMYEAKNSFINGIYVSVSAQIFTLPAVLYFFFQLPVYSVFVNIIVVPLTTLLILTSLAAGILGIISLPSGRFLAGGAKYILGFYEIVCRLGNSLPGSLITVGRPDMIRIIIYFILVFIFIGLNGKSGKQTGKQTGKKRYLIILAVAVGILVFPKPGKGLAVAFLDVGQGDAIFMETRKGTTFLIDGGSMDVGNVGIYRIRPYLLSRGVDRIDYAIVTHADKDHVSGLMELISDSKIKVSNLILPKIDRSGERKMNRIVNDNEKENAYYGNTYGNAYVKDYENTEMKDSDNYGVLEALAETYKVNTMYIKAGDYIKEGMLDITCLHPFEGYKYSSENAYSTVLSVSYGDFDMLLTGDLEADGEKIIVSKLTEKTTSLQSAKLKTVKSPSEEWFSLPDGYEVLKVAHHGSRNSTSEEFLSFIRPKIAVISCSLDNKRVTKLIQFRFLCSSL